MITDSGFTALLESQLFQNAVISTENTLADPFLCQIQAGRCRQSLIWTHNDTRGRRRLQLLHFSSEKDPKIWWAFATSL